MEIKVEFIFYDRQIKIKFYSNLACKSILFFYIKRFRKYNRQYTCACSIPTYIILD